VDLFNSKDNYRIRVFDNFISYNDVSEIYLGCSRGLGFMDNNHDNPWSTTKPKQTCVIYPPSEQNQTASHSVIHNLVTKTILNSKQFRFFSETHKVDSITLNKSSFGTSDLVHVDSNDNNNYTILAYVNSEWNIDWGGETLFYDSNLQEIVKATIPKPGRVVIFDSTLPHSARPPQIHCQYSRCVLAIKLVKKENNNLNNKSNGKH